MAHLGVCDCPRLTLTPSGQEEGGGREAGFTLVTCTSGYFVVDRRQESPATWSGRTIGVSRQLQQILRVVCFRLPVDSTLQLCLTTETNQEIGTERDSTRLPGGLSSRRRKPELVCLKNLRG